MEQIKKNFGCMRLPMNGENVRLFFESQLAACGVEYFDFYLMHAQGAGNYPHFKACLAYETAFALKAEGKVRHVGISFHDRAEVLEQILTDYPQIEVVQIQFNYLDYDDPTVQSRRCYEVCRKFGKPVIVMEPVKGGNLVNLPDDARAVLDGLRGGSPASYAIRFATMNTKQIHHDWNADYYYNVVHTAPGRRASDCVKCGRCEKVCPQHLPIRRLLEDVAKKFEKEAN